MELGNAQAIAEKWGFVPTEEMPGGHCSKVYANSSQVLKVPYQGEEMTSGFRAALSLSENFGPRVFESDPELPAILMERMIPGTTLEQLNLPDEEALQITAKLTLGIQNGSREGCVSLKEYMASDDPLAIRLLETTDREVFLHGDLHHANILLHGDEWRIIDPKGVIGDRAFEPTAFLRNPLDKVPHMPNLEDVMRRRISSFAQALNLDPWRICAWSIVDLRSWAEHEWQRVVEVLEVIEAELRNGPLKPQSRSESR